MYKLTAVNQHLWAARKTAGLSQTALAQKAAMDQADISLIENDGWLPPDKVRQRLAEALDTSVEALFPNIPTGEPSDAPKAAAGHP